MIKPEIVIDALLSDTASLVAGLGGDASTGTRGGASMWITGSAIPFLNGVVTRETSASAVDVEALLDLVANKHVPHALQIRPGCAQEITDLAGRRGMVADAPTPLMVLHRDQPETATFADHPRLSITALRPDEAAIHASIGAKGFEVPVEIFDQLITRDVMSRPGFRAYAGTVDGEPVTTALGITNGAHVGIFNVATPAGHRGQGYGAAITAWAARDGFNSGASFAYLQSSAMGLRVYERLGFHTVETWSVWISPSSPSHS